MSNTIDLNHGSGAVYGGGKDARSMQVREGEMKPDASKTLAVAEEVALPAVFDPADTKANVSKADAIITLAKDLKDWPLLERAVDAKIEEQAQFVMWWDANVRRKGKRKKDNNAESELLLSVDAAEKRTGIKQEQVSRWRKRLKDRDAYRKMLLRAAWKTAFEDASQLNQQSISNEHYTPAPYINAAKAVMGGVTLDPATCAKANETVQAETHYTAADNGLEKEWAGKVWLNPPYGKNVGKFVGKFVDGVSRGLEPPATLQALSRCQAC